MLGAGEAVPVWGSVGSVATANATANHFWGWAMRLLVALPSASKGGSGWGWYSPVQQPAVGAGREHGEGLVLARRIAVGHERSVLERAARLHHPEVRAGDFRPVALPGVDSEQTDERGLARRRRRCHQRRSAVSSSPPHAATIRHAARRRGTVRRSEMGIMTGSLRGRAVWWCRS